MIVAATHKGCKYLIKIYQHDIQSSASKGVHAKDRINYNTITWFVQVWPKDHSGAPTQPLYCLKLCYNFNFVDIKAAHVAFVPFVFALQTPAAIDAYRRYKSCNPLSTPSNEVNVQGPPDSRSHFVSHGWSSLLGVHCIELTKSVKRQLAEFGLGRGQPLPSFLRWIDGYLQWFTLGITAQQQAQPPLCDYRFRVLSNSMYHVSTGDATGAFHRQCPGNSGITMPQVRH
jgi:hypothetical protein